MTGAVDYTPFLEGAKANIQDPKAQGWLSGHNLKADAIKRLGLGYYDPQEHGELTTILNSIYQAQGVGEMARIDSPVIVVPYEGSGYWVGIYTAPRGLALYLKPKAGASEIWNQSALWTSEGEPVIIAPSVLDAIALESLGYSTIAIDGATMGPLADMLKAKPSGGPLVIIPPRKDQTEIETTAQVVATLGDLGASVLNYDLSNHEGEYNGAMETLRVQGADSLRAVMDDLRKWTLNDLKGERAQYLQGSTGASVEAFRKAIGERTGAEATPTGIKGLDDLLDGGLFPGLYILGAVSSLGKTTFALQIADHVAEEGRDVLFFSLEQSKEELMAKSVSRLTASMELIGDTPLTSRQILYKMKDWIGTNQERALDSAIMSYKEDIGPRMFIIENDTRPALRKNSAGELEIMRDPQGEPIQTVQRIGLDTIRDRVKEHIRIMGKDRAPVVFIDYLQILRPDDSTGRKSDKQNMDETVSELRRISKAHQIPIVAISSLNRSAYGQPITMEAFKESGAIEYSSDVLLGLNPSGLNYGEAEKTRKANRKVFDSLGDNELRDMEAVILKNRLGSLGKVPLVLNAYYGLYTEGRMPRGSDEYGGIFDGA